MKIMNCGLIFPAEGSKQYFSHFFDCFAFYSISLNVLRPCGMQQIAHCHALRLQIPSTGVIECVSGLLLVEIKKQILYETACFRRELYFHVFCRCAETALMSNPLISNSWCLNMCIYIYMRTYVRTYMPVIAVILNDYESLTDRIFLVMTPF